MSNDIKIQIMAFSSVAILFLKKSWQAVLACAIAFLGMHVLPADSWLAGRALAVMSWVEGRAPKMGETLLFALCCILFCLVASVLAERNGSNGWRLIGGAAGWFVRSMLIPDAIGITLTISGVAAAFGIEGVLFGAVFLFWMYFVVACVQSFVGFAAMPAR